MSHIVPVNPIPFQSSSSFVVLTNSGSISVSSGVFSILGGNPATTTAGTGTTVFISTSGTGAAGLLTIQADSGTASASGGIINLTSPFPSVFTTTATMNTVNFSLVNVSVAFGGTGQTTLPLNGLLYGQGSSPVGSIAAGLNGQVLIGGTGLPPQFSFITSSGGTLSFTYGPNSLNIDLSLSSFSFFFPITVPQGGTGLTMLTAFGVLIGEGQNNVDVTAAGTDGQVLIAATGADPAFSTLVSNSGTVTFTFGPNSVSIDVSSENLTFTTPWTVPVGGTGQTVLTTYGVLIGEGSNNINVTAAGTDGQVLIAATGADPAFSTLASNSGTVTFTFGPNSVSIDVSSENLTFTTPWTVPVGGTGQTVLTTYGVLIGEGSNNVNVTAAGTNGQVLIASSTGDPQFSTITSIGGTLSFTAGYNSLNIEIAIEGFTFPTPVTVAFGGTGQTLLTTYGVLIGEGSNNVNVTAAGTNGQVLIASSTGDPQFATITSSGGTVTFTFGYNSLNIEVNSSSATFALPWLVTQGGTGLTLMTAYGVLIGEGSNNVNVTAAGTNGQVLIASSTGDPAFATITSSGGTVTFTFGYNSLNIEVNSSSATFALPWLVTQGGTGLTLMTAYGVLIGEGSNNVNVTAAGTNGQVLIASSTGDPAFATITSTGGTLTFKFGYNSLNIDIGIAGFTFQNPWPVQNGGTGRTILTMYGVLVGEGSNKVNVTAAGTNGQVLLGSTTGDPKFNRITSTGGTLTFTFGYNSLNIDIGITGFTFLNPWPVQNGGTGLTILTTYGVLLGEGSNNVNVTAAGTDGQVLIASSTGDPAFATITSTGGTLTFTFGNNSLNIDIGIDGFTFLNPWPVQNGGTGLTILTAFGVLVGEGPNNVNVTAAGTDGQVLIGSSIGDPAFALITSSGGTITFTVGANSLNIEVNAPGFTYITPWSVGKGGTGRTLLTTRGVLIGEGSNQVNVTAAGTNGQILIAGSTGDPKFSTITSTGGTVTFTFGYNSINVEVNAPGFTFLNPWPVQNGGTGRTIFTSRGVLLGEGSNQINVTAAGTNGQVFIASSTGDPKFSTITSTGGTITFSFGYNSLNIEVNAPGFTYITPWPVGKGGTGQTILTTYGVLIGEGSNLVNVTAAGTNGQVLIASSSGDPAFATITSTGGTLTFTFGYNSMNIEVNAPGFTYLNPWPVQNGGTGLTLLTTFGVLIGEGSNNVNVTAAGTNGQILIASSTGDPAFATITSTGGTVTFTFGYNSINIEVNPPSFTFVTPWNVPLGGTGRSVLTLHGVLIGEGSNNVNVTAAGTNGQVLIGSSTGDPKFSTITSTGGTITFTFGYNSMNIEVNAPGFTYLNPWPVQNGGTGRTILTMFGVLIGEGSNNVNVTASGTNGQILIASSTGDPKFSSVTSSGGTVFFTFGYNSLNIEVNPPTFTFVTPWTVGLGGTGRTILTTYGVLLGEGSNNMNVTAAGTNGQVLIASSTGDPAFATITSSTLTFIPGYNSLNIEIAIGGFTFPIPVTVDFGGTGRTVLTAYGVLLGEGSNNVNVTAAGTNGQVLIASSTGDPAFSTITSSTLTFIPGYNSLNIEIAIGGFTFPTPVTVDFGGTGRTVLTAYGVLLGEGSNNVNVTAAGTNGQVLIASSTGDPAFSTITSSTLTFVSGYNSLNIEIAIGGFTFPTPLTVDFGGTGRTVLTAYGVLLGEGSNNVNVTAAGTNGQVLIASSTGDPAFSTITSIGGTLTFTFGYNSLNIDIGIDGFTYLNPWPVQNGGTGLTVLTTYGVLIGEGSNNVNVTAAGTNGQILIASSTGDPAFTTITSSGGSITFTFGYNSLNLEVSASSFTFVTPWPVDQGGTGLTLLTTFGVLIGEGSNNVNVTAAGTDGQVLIASSIGDPAFSTITSTGGTITFTVGTNSLNIEVDTSIFTFPTPWPVSKGGTGRTILTTRGVLIGEGSNNVNVTAAGTNGQVLIASSTGDPKFSTITSTGGTLTFKFGYNSLNVDIAIAGFTYLNPWPVKNGGTGQTILTTYGVLIGEGSNDVNVTAAGTDGQVLISSSTGDPAFATITSTGGSLTFTFGANSLNIDLAIDGFTYLNPWPVQNGGTGLTVLTAYGVLIGEGSNNVNVTAAGTDGQILIASSTGDPAFSTITSTGGTLTFTFGANSLNVDIAIDGFTYLNPWPVQNGGTGLTILTAFGVLIGEGANNVNVTAAGTDGQVLIASSIGDPAFSTITSTGGTLTFTFGQNSLNVDIAIRGFTFLNPWPVQNGGTGRTILTTFGVLLGEGSNKVNVTAAGTNGQFLIASSTGDPKFSTITSTGGTVTFTFGYNSLNIEINAPGFTYLNPWPVKNGGTGRTILTTYGVLLGEGSNKVNVTDPGTNGQVLIASSTGDPSFSTITSSGGTITFSFGYNAINLEVSSGTSFQWTTTSASGSLQNNQGFICIGGSPLTFSLPVSPIVGTQTAIALYSATSWDIVLSGTEAIQFGYLSTSASGGLQSTSIGDVIYLVCVDPALSAWIATSSIGNINVI